MLCSESFDGMIIAILPMRPQIVRQPSINLHNMVSAEKGMFAPHATIIFLNKSTFISRHILSC